MYVPGTSGLTFKGTDQCQELEQDIRDVALDAAMLFFRKNDGLYINDSCKKGYYSLNFQLQAFISVQPKLAYTKFTKFYWNVSALLTLLK